ncbi:hypothetical protein [Collimonas sp.]|uniref:hypothetical protein n=1 Tax=Collimonas sp. TaxID=1963772 RepID=UPI002C80207C|nr:hypothetical protein [Collimonas sp.]HWW04755.1 hypothetical protein [Collimonas sp.]
MSWINRISGYSNQNTIKSQKTLLIQFYRHLRYIFVLKLHAYFAIASLGRAIASQTGTA